METKSNTAKINGKQVQGRGHLQPGVNHWIGIFMVGDDLLEDDSDQWKSVIIEYEGPFNCENGCTNGKGKAKINHVRPDSKSKKLIINVEGIDNPVFDKEIDKGAQFHYNVNLPRE